MRCSMNLLVTLLFVVYATVFVNARAIGSKSEDSIPNLVSKEPIEWQDQPNLIGRAAEPQNCKRQNGEACPAPVDTDDEDYNAYEVSFVEFYKSGLAPRWQHQAIMVEDMDSIDATLYHVTNSKSDRRLRYEVRRNFRLNHDIGDKRTEGYIYPKSDLATFEALARIEELPRFDCGENCHDWVASVLKKAKARGIIKAKRPNPQ